MGNIIHKDDAGDLKYTNPAKPFTLTQIDNAVANISFNTLSASYTDFRKVNQISEVNTNKQMDFVYGNDYERLKMDYKLNGINQYTRYYAEDYDLQESATGSKAWTYIAAPSGLCAVYYNNNGTTELNYVLSDHLGSPILLSNTSQQIVEEYSYDSWGRRRNASDWSYTAIAPSTKLIRGYTLHEMVDEFGLINMNGRVYDPVMGRFVQPDKYVQAPANIQNFNRYSYVMNNPLNYTDPSGNIFLGLIRGVLNSVFSGGLEFWNADKDYVGNAWSKSDPFAYGTAGNNSYRMWKGYFGSPGFFTQLPQNTIGMVFGHAANLLGNVRGVDYYGGATVVKGTHDGLIWGRGGPGMTVGSFIIGDESIEANPYNRLFQHEFGHVLQSREMRWGYLSRVAIPSIRSQHGDYKKNYPEHDFHPVEQDASRRAFLYFNENEKGFYENNGWDYANPLDIDGDNRGDRVDYRKNSDLLKLNSNRTVHASWLDRYGWVAIWSPFAVGMYNSYLYNH